ncbi:hypothetical protein AB0C24_26840 [Amycolatopsis japonica]|uniref:hypothetical protein n=1 Tax=Amycolatopsis japonica TaxID=208439 RepID=UPI0033C9C4EB
MTVDAMIEDLRTLVEIESPSGDIEALTASAEAVAALIEARLGGTATLAASAAGPHVRWSGGGEPRVLILGHHDTVFPIGTLARRPFAVDGGRVTGPGESPGSSSRSAPARAARSSSSKARLTAAVSRSAAKAVARSRSSSPAGRRTPASNPSWA